MAGKGSSLGLTDSAYRDLFLLGLFWVLAPGHVWVTILEV